MRNEKDVLCTRSKLGVRVEQMSTGKCFPPAGGEINASWSDEECGGGGRRRVDEVIESV